MNRNYKHSLAIILLTCFCQTIFAQANNPLTKSDTIPFQLTAWNNLSVQAILNKTDTVQLMLHTAANAVTLTEATIEKIKSLRFEGADSVKSWGGQGNTSRYSKSNSLQIGQLQWEEVAIWEDKNSGQNTAGKCGLNLFANKIIEIDFNKQQIILYNDLPAKASQYDKLPLFFERDMLFVEATCHIGKDTLHNRFLLHSGYSGDILLDDQFAAKNNLDKQLPIVAQKELKDAFGNSIKTQRVILPAFTIGKTTLTNAPAGFFTGALGRQKFSIIGGDILKRFNIIIDAQRTYIYLQANEFLKEGYTNV